MNGSIKKTVMKTKQLQNQDNTIRFYNVYRKGNFPIIKTGNRSVTGEKVDLQNMDFIRRTQIGELKNDNYKNLSDDFKNIRSDPPTIDV